MSHLILQPGLTIDDDVRHRIETFYAWPDEKVVLDPEARWDGEDSDENDLKVLQMSGPLIVDELHVIASVEGNGFVDVVYKIRGMEGLHNATCFMNPEGVEHCYGTLITREGQTYLVPMEGHYENPVAGAPKLIDPDMSRSAKYIFNIDGERHTVEGYLSGHDAEPATGEYYIIPKGDNHYQLTNSPWMSSATEHELSQSELSIAQYKESAMHIAMLTVSGIKESAPRPAIHSKQWFDECFNSPVPDDFRALAEDICKTYQINGVSDPMYIANTIAMLTGSGDGAGQFASYRPAIDGDHVAKVANRLVFAYGHNINGDDQANLEKLIAQTIIRQPDLEQDSEFSPH